MFSVDPMLSIKICIYCSKRCSCGYRYRCTMHVPTFRSFFLLLCRTWEQNKYAIVCGSDANEIVNVKCEYIRMTATTNGRRHRTSHSPTVQRFDRQTFTEKNITHTSWKLVRFQKFVRMAERKTAATSTSARNFWAWSTSNHIWRAQGHHSSLLISFKPNNAHSHKHTHSHSHSSKSDGIVPQADVSYK